MSKPVDLGKVRNRRQERIDKEELAAARRIRGIKAKEYGRQKSRARAGLAHWLVVAGRTSTEYQFINELLDNSVVEHPWSWEARHGSEALAKWFGLSYRTLERVIASLKKDRIITVTKTDPEHPHYVRYTIAERHVEAMISLGRHRWK